MSRAVIELFHMARGIVLLKPYIASISSNFGRKMLSCCDIELTVAAWPASFSKKYGASCSKSAPNSDTLRIHLFFTNHTSPNPKQFCRLTNRSENALRIISLEKSASTFSRLIIIHSTLSYRITLHFYQLSTVLFPGLPTTWCKNGSKFKSCVNFGTLYIKKNRSANIMR